MYFQKKIGSNRNFTDGMAGSSKTEQIFIW